MYDDHDAGGARLPYQLRADTADHFVILDYEEWKLIATAFGGAPQLLESDADEAVVRRLVQRGVLEQVDRRTGERPPAGRRSRGFSRGDTQLEAAAGLGEDAPAPVPYPGPPMTVSYASPADSPGRPPEESPVDPDDDRYGAEEPETPPAPWGPVEVEQPTEPAPTSPAATAEDDRRRALEDLLRILSR